VPFVDVAENPSETPAPFLKYPTVVQLPADAHETENADASGSEA
jgi:hypothetical protein